jgi:Carboxypeptidase regulatory-like domain
MRAPVSTAIALFLVALPVVAQDGTASLTGKVQDPVSAGAADTLVELVLTRAPVILFQSIADSGGVYRFTRLPAGEYDLTLSHVGFNTLTVKSTIILNGEHRAMPTLQLSAGANGDCSHPGEPDAIRFFRSQTNVGSFGGTVRLGGTTVSGADITLKCTTGKPCGAARTDSGGQFLFKALPSGYFSVRVTGLGFYPEDSPTYRVAAGAESAYASIYIDRCPLGNCDPKLRTEKPPAICE